MLSELKSKIDEIEKKVLELEALGREIPVVKKNTTAMLSFISVLKFGISDIIEVKGAERRQPMTEVKIVLPEYCTILQKTVNQENIPTI